MIFRYFAIAIISGLFCASCASVKMNTKTTDTLMATALKPEGRYIINDEQNLELISTAVHFGFSFEGNECLIYTSLPWQGGHNYLQYELDGIYQKKIRVEGNSTQPISLTANKGGKHTVWIYKATEAHSGAIVIKKITGKNIKSLDIAAAPLIEFIGNSITCGAAADSSDIPCGKGDYHDHHNAYYAYGPRVARALKVNYIVSGVSGIGVYRNWNSDSPTMPQVYEKVDFQDNNPKQWNFGKSSPKIVSIALGTNDLSRGDGIKSRLPFDSSSFINAYVKFIQLVKSKYPAAQLVLLSSPMSGGNDRTLLNNCLSSVKQKVDVLYNTDKPIVLHFFQPMQPHGCSGHPSIEDHGLLANELVPLFKKLL